HIHTSAIKRNLIPTELSSQQISFIYADEADVLNVALFGITAKQWRCENSDKEGNMRDYASINELICLSNMENLNAVFINEGLPQRERLIKLNQTAIQQMQILLGVENRKLLN
ncbi:MAG: KilA-N domain-containing protein, partial [Bacteroidales bacterium]|nr:KilA-N domain-containing protein [Bacteroidales bacterium]